ncbi:TetR/AcrR family transcriptional regulator [Natronospora cellulosivora (SeqCode)]
MPSKTFFNLPAEKKERIVKAAQEEFAHNLFKECSVASIIKKAEIPRGSFYQYFEDLKDLYKYTMDIIAEKKLEYFNNTMAEMDIENIETIELFKGLYRMGIKFARDNPQYAAIANNLYKEERKFREEIYDGFEEKGLGFYKNIIKNGQNRGDISEKVDVEILSIMLYSLNMEFADLFLKKIFINHDNFEEMSEEGLTEYLEKLDKMFYIIENGVR